MKGVELHGQVQRAIYPEGLSRREAARRFGTDPRTVAKMLASSVPQGYRRGWPPVRPKLELFGIIDRILEEDEDQSQPSSKGIFERLTSRLLYGAPRRCALPFHCSGNRGPLALIDGGFTLSSDILEANGSRTAFCRIGPRAPKTTLHALSDIATTKGRRGCFSLSGRRG
jgi:hypothetical protein